MKKIKPILHLLLIVGLCFSLTGCVHLRNNIKVFSNGEYTSTIKLLVLENVYDSLELDKKEYLEFFQEQFHVEDINDIKMIEEKINHEVYRGFEYTHKRGLPIDSSNIHIDVDKTNKQITFKLSNELSNDVWFFSDALNPRKSIDEIDVLLVMQIDMPGNIISSSSGTIEDDIVTIDLIENKAQEIVVISNIESTIPRLSIITFVIILISSITIKFINNEKRAK